MSDQCRTCQAPIIWAITTKGKSIPVDAEPCEYGNIDLTTAPSGKVFARVLRSPVEGSQLYVSHFVSCPDASVHRRRR